MKTLYHFDIDKLPKFVEVREKSPWVYGKSVWYAEVYSNRTGSAVVGWHNNYRGLNLYYSGISKGLTLDVSTCHANILISGQDVHKIFEDPNNISDLQLLAFSIECDLDKSTCEQLRDILHCIPREVSCE